MRFVFNYIFSSKAFACFSKVGCMFRPPCPHCWLGCVPSTLALLTPAEEAVDWLSLFLGLVGKAQLLSAPCLRQSAPLPPLSHRQCWAGSSTLLTCQRGCGLRLLLGAPADATLAGKWGNIAPCPRMEGRGPGSSYQPLLGDGHPA